MSPWWAVGVGLLVLAGCSVPPGYPATGAAGGLPVGATPAYQPPAPVVRGQYSFPGPGRPQPRPPGFDGHPRQPMQPAGDGRTPAEGGSSSAAYQPPPGGLGAPAGSQVYVPPPAPGTAPGFVAQGPNNPLVSPYLGAPDVPPDQYLGGSTADLDVFVEEGRTGSFIVGVGVNSDAGVTGQIIVDERNFDLFRFPRSLRDLTTGAFRGRGQGLRIEAIPGSEVQRYLVSFTEPYLLWTPISLNVSGFMYDRRYRDWDEQRLGGRLGLGYRLTSDLLLQASFRGEQVDIHNPRVIGVSELDQVLGENDIFGGGVTLRHDTRDMPFLPTEGHLFEMSFEQIFGDYDYPKAQVEYRRYFLLRERADGSGRHTLAMSIGAGFTGAQTPIFEHFFAGGFSTLRGFDFRGASPVDRGVVVGGDFRMLGSAEYLFPLTADDMLRGVVFCDFGTVEENIEIEADDFRVAPGFGVRIAIPALGPAPLAVDVAFPVAHEITDDIQNVSFFFGFIRS